MIHYFTDPVLRSPTIASCLMCFSSSLIGSLIFLRKQSLLSEALSHSAYPGVILGVLFVALVDWGGLPFMTQALILMGAFLGALAGMLAIRFLEVKLKIRSDSALCAVLSSFFGLGVLFASYIQASWTPYYRLIQVYIYGQTATMTDSHIALFFVLSLLVCLFVVMFYKEFKAVTFDPQFASTIGIKVRFIDAVLYALLIMALIIGIRSVGVVLMSAMLIGPAISARQFSNSMGKMLALSACFGSFSGLMGTVLSNELSLYFSQGERISIPTGPLIVVISSSITVFALLFRRMHPSR